MTPTYPKRPSTVPLAALSPYAIAPQAYLPTAISIRAGNHRSIESGRLALPDVLAAGARHRLRGMFLCHRLLADGTIFTPHIGSAFSSANTLQRSRARHADRSLRRILPAVEVL